MKMMEILSLAGLDENEFGEMLIREPGLIDLNSGGQTALHCAAQNGYSKITAILLSLRPNMINQLNDEGETVLHCAAEGGHRDIVAQLLVHMPPALIGARGNRNTALDYAIKGGHDEVVAQLLDHRPELISTVTRFDCESSLFLAAIQGFDKVVAQLLARRPKFDIRPGFTILHSAIKFGRDKVAEQFLDYDPSMVTLVAHDNENLLHVAVENHEKMVTLLLARNPKLAEEKTTKTGDTPLHIAVKDKHEEIVEQLLAHDPKLAGIVNSHGESPLMNAVQESHLPVAMFKMLLAARPEDAFAIDRKGNTLLHHVVQWWFVSKGAELMEEVWRMNPQAMRVANNKGQTPLSLASIAHLKGIDLLQSGLDIDDIQQAYRPSDHIGYWEWVLPVIQGQCESLLMDLGRDLLPIVSEYLGLELRPNQKRKLDTEEEVEEWRRTEITSPWIPLDELLSQQAAKERKQAKAKKKKVVK